MARVLADANTLGAASGKRPPSRRAAGLGAAAIKAVGPLHGTMSSLRSSAESDTAVAQLLSGVLEQTGYPEALRAERTIEAQGRIENLEELVNVAAEYDVTRGRAGTRSPTSSRRSRSSPTRTRATTTPGW